MLKPALIVPLLVALTAAVCAGSLYDNDVAQRIKPYGQVCISGEPCEGVVLSVAQPVATEPRSGEAVYQAACLGCHATGALNAPKLGDAQAWAARLDQGLEQLTEHAINGFQAMPAKGGCATCSDEEIASAVAYMVDNSR